MWVFGFGLAISGVPLLRKRPLKSLAGRPVYSQSRPLRAQVAAAKRYRPEAPEGDGRSEAAVCVPWAWDRLTTETLLHRLRCRKRVASDYFLNRK